MATFDLKNVSIERHPDGRVHKLRSSIALQGSGNSAVAGFLHANAQHFGISADPKSLRLLNEAKTPIGDVYRYQYCVNDIPVFKSYVVAHTDGQSTLKHLELSHSLGNTAVASVAGGDIGPSAALDTAMKNLGTPTLRGKQPPPSQVYFPTGPRLQLAYLVLVLTQNPLHDWQLIIDAHSAAVLDKTDVLKSAPDGTGYTFDPNPVVTANDNTLRQPTASAAGGCGYAGSAVATIDAQRVTRDLKGLTLVGGVHHLEGPYAKVVNISAPASTIPTEVNANDFKYPSSDERLGAVSSYYHVDTIQRYIQSLGILTANNRQTQIDPAVSGFSAYYSPGDLSLHMGTSRPCHPDKSQEGDAIIHEYGHAIQDNQVPGWGGTNPVTLRDETGAMGEGFGDTLACVFFANAGNQFQRETFEDWAYVENGAAGLRRVDGTKVYPTDWAGEVHADGEIWSAALWNIYRAVGGDSLVVAERQAARDALLKSVILSHHLLAPTATMPEGAEAVMNTHAALDDYRGKYLMQMLDSFHDRGLLACAATANVSMRDAAADTGAEPYGGSVFWESPDLWVRNADDGGTAHQEPEFGQDNYFYARVTNHGTTAARAFVVTFNVKPWAGVQFVYPGDFVPFVSAVPGFNLAPGASLIVKAKWPAALIPPTGTHACMLGQVYMPTDTTPAGSHVWDKNNLAQKNMTIVDAIAGDVVFARFQLGTLHERHADLYDVELQRPVGQPELAVSLAATNPAVTKQLFHSADNWTPVTPPKPRAATLRFADHAIVQLEQHEEAPPVRFVLAPGSSVSMAEPGPRAAASIDFPRQARLVGAGQRTEIEFFPGRAAGFPVVFQPSSQLKCTLKIRVPRDAKPGSRLSLRLVQRAATGKIAGGITIVINVRGA